jgi:hypothetical protein
VALGIRETVLAAMGASSDKDRQLGITPKRRTARRSFILPIFWTDPGAVENAASCSSGLEWNLAVEYLSQSGAKVKNDSGWT